MRDARKKSAFSRNSPLAGAFRIVDLVGISMCFVFFRTLEKIAVFDIGTLNISGEIRTLEFIGTLTKFRVFGLSRKKRFFEKKTWFDEIGDFDERSLTFPRTLK